MRPGPGWLTIVATVLSSAATPAGAEDAAGMLIREALVIPGSDFYRSAASVDPIEARIVTGEWSPPHEGDVVAFPDGARSWRRVEADSAGWIADDDLEDGYAYATVDVDADRVLILEGYGYQLAYVNGEPRAGNLYGMKDEWAAWEPRSDFSRLPVQLSAGRNHFLFVRSRVGAVKARLVPPPADYFLNTRDVTIPDLVAGQEGDAPGAVVVVNATTDWARDLRLVATAGSGAETTTVVPDLPPLSLRKVGFEIRLGVPPATSDVTLMLRLAASHGDAAFHEDTKARFDAEAFWYQANGSIGVAPDVAFDPDAEPDRNVVLYGNSSTNRAWDALLGGSPVQVARGKLRVGEARFRGDDLGVLMIRPRPGSDVASVGVVSGTGVAGMRLCDRRPYLSAGFAYPDVTVFRARDLGATGDCAILAGFFGLDWSLEAGDFAGTDDFGR